MSWRNFFILQSQLKGFLASRLQNNEVYELQNYSLRTPSTSYTLNTGTLYTNMFRQEESYIANGIFVSPKSLQSMMFFASSFGQSCQFGSASENTKFRSKIHEASLRHLKTMKTLTFICKRKPELSFLYTRLHIKRIVTL